MSKRKVVSKRDGSKTVLQGGRIVGNLPSNKALNPVAGPSIVSEPAAATSKVTSEFDTVHAAFRAWNSEEIRRIYGAAQEELEVWLSPWRGTSGETRRTGESYVERQASDQEWCMNIYMAIPEQDRPILSPKDLKVLKIRANTEVLDAKTIRYIAGEGTHEEQSARVMGYMIARMNMWRPSLSPQEVVSQELLKRAPRVSFRRNGISFCSACGTSDIDYRHFATCPAM